MSIETVNGYVCSNCTEAAQAKRGINPHANSAQPANEKSSANAVLEDQRPRANLGYSQTLDRLA